METKLKIAKTFANGIAEILAKYEPTDLNNLIFEAVLIGCVGGFIKATHYGDSGLDSLSDETLNLLKKRGFLLEKNIRNCQGES